MNKVILAMLSITMSASIMAAPTLAPAPATEVAKTKAKTDADFAKHKALTLEAIDKRDKIIDIEKACVTAAQEMTALKNCFIVAKENRKEMGKELKAKAAK